MINGHFNESPIYVFIRPLHYKQGVAQGQFFLQVEYSWFEFSLFFLLDWLPNQD